MLKVYLKPGKLESLQIFHPWIFSGAISRIVGAPAECELAEVYFSTTDYLANWTFLISSISV